MEYFVLRVELYWTGSCRSGTLICLSINNDNVLTANIYKLLYGSAEPDYLKEMFLSQIPKYSFKYNSVIEPLLTSKRLYVDSFNFGRLLPWKNQYLWRF